MKLRKWARYALKAREAWKIIADLFGWKRSFNEGRPLDGEGRPIPWYTYPAIEFIRTLRLDGCRVFEYGSGNSSFFWAQRVMQVIAVESNPVWADEVRSKKVENLTLITLEKKDDYVKAPLSAGGQFDIVVVDGRYRRECAVVAADIVNDQGMIIFDNADWYPDACSLIRSRGWLQIDFSGLGPIAPFPWTTSVFIKSRMSFERNSSYALIGASIPVWRADD